MKGIIILGVLLTMSVGPSLGQPGHGDLNEMIRQMISVHIQVVDVVRDLCAQGPDSRSCRLGREKTKASKESIDKAMRSLEAMGQAGRMAAKRIHEDYPDWQRY